MPTWIGFAPDGLVKGQCCLQGSGILKSQIISRNPATIVIENNGEPGLGEFALFVENQDRQERMIGLPHLIGEVCLVTIQQIKLLSVDFRSLVRQRHERGIKLSNNPFDGAIAWSVASLFF